MKRIARLACGALVAAGLSSPAAVRAAAYEVAAGVTNTVSTETELAAIEAQGEVVLKSATSALVFKTDRAPAVTISGNGTLEKQGTANWTLTQNISGFLGNVVFRGGVTTFTHASQLGGSSTATHVYVWDDATLCATDSTTSPIKMGSRTLHVKGTGASGQGAFVLGAKNNSNAELMGAMVLEGDTLLVLDYQMYSRGKLTLNGHTLTKRGGDASTEWFWQSGGTDATGSIIIETGILKIADGWTTDGETALTAGALHMKDGTTLHFRNATPKQYRPIRISGNVKAGTNWQYGGVPANGYDNTTVRHQAGPIALDEGAVLTWTDDVRGAMFTISGAITGAGKFVTSSSHRGTLRLTNPNNTFSGKITFTGYYANYNDIEATYAGSVPDYANAGFSYARLRVPMTADDSTWTPNDVMRLVCAATFESTDCGSAVALMTTNCPDGAYTFDLSQVTTPLTPASTYARVAHYGTGTLDFTGTADLTKIWTGTLGGTTAFTGAGTKVSIGHAFAYAPPGTQRAFDLPDVADAALIVRDGAQVITTNQLVTLGCTSSSDWGTVRNGFGRLVVTNALLTTSVPDIGDQTWYYQGGVAVGYNGTGVLEIAEGACVTNRVYVGAGRTNSVGAVCQRAGDVTLFGPRNTESALWSGTRVALTKGGLGYYELTDGTLTLVGGMTVGSNGSGIFEQRGGVVNVTNSPTGANGLLRIGLDAGSCGVFRMTGGTFTTYSLDCARNGDDVETVVTLDGDDAELITYGGYIGLNYSENGGTSTTFNFNAGVMDPYFFCCRFTYPGYTAAHPEDKTAANSYKAAPDVNYNFNGGTVRLSAAATCRASCLDAFAGFDGRYAPDKIRVFENGATIDVTETAVRAATSIPFVAPSGKGVAAIAWSGTGYVAPPRVMIEGDGRNATAVALYDSTAQRVTGVRITSHGENYTHATAHFVSGTLTNASVTCTLADNVSGSFTKKGAGTYTFKATNTYAGATILQGGKLKCGVDWAIPTNGTVVLAGGTLDMNGKTLEGGAAAPKKWGIDAAYAAAQGGVTYAGDLTFLPDATLDVANVDLLPDGQKGLTLLTVTGTITGTKPNLGASPDSRYTYSWSGNSIKLKRLLGTVITIR